MIKKIFALAMIAIPTIQADWLDDLAQLSHVGFFSRKDQVDISKAQGVLKKHIASDECEIKRIDKLIELNNKQEDALSTVHNAAYNTQLAAAKVQLDYHHKVERSIKELLENKRDREKFIARITGLHKAIEELKGLKSKLDKADNTADKIKLTAHVAAKELEVQSKKAFIKTTFLL